MKITEIYGREYRKIKSGDNKTCPISLRNAIDNINNLLSLGIISQREATMKKKKIVALINDAHDDFEHYKPADYEKWQSHLNETYKSLSYIGYKEVYKRHPEDSWLDAE
jgi:hypothetical protein